MPPIQRTVKSVEAHWRVKSGLYCTPRLYCRLFDPICPDSSSAGVGQEAFSQILFLYRFQSSSPITGRCRGEKSEPSHERANVILFYVGDFLPDIMTKITHVSAAYVLRCRVRTSYCQRDNRLVVWTEKDEFSSLLIALSRPTGGRLFGVNYVFGKDVCRE